MNGCGAAMASSSVHESSSPERRRDSCLQGRPDVSSRLRSRIQEFLSKYELAASRSSPGCAEQNSCVLEGSRQVTRKMKSDPHRASKNVCGATEAVKNFAKNQLTSKEEVETKEISGTPLEIRLSQMKNLPSIYSCAKTMKTRSTNMKTSPLGLKSYTHEEVQEIQTSTTENMLDSPNKHRSTDESDSLNEQQMKGSTKSNLSLPLASDFAKLRFIKSTGDNCIRLPGESPFTKDRSAPITRNLRYPSMQRSSSYVIIPSWPSYKDILKLNSCCEHLEFMAKLHLKNFSGTLRKTSHDNSHMTSYSKESDSGHSHWKEVRHIPSDVRADCVMCNLYKTDHVIPPCPPNTPRCESVNVENEIADISTTDNITTTYS